MTYSGVAVPAQAFVEVFYEPRAAFPVIAFTVPGDPLDYEQVEFIAGDDPSCEATLDIRFTGEGIPAEYKTNPNCVAPCETVTVYSGISADGLLELSAPAEPTRSVPIAVRSAPDQRVSLSDDYVWNDAAKRAQAVEVLWRGGALGQLAAVLGCDFVSEIEGPNLVCAGSP